MTRAVQPALVAYAARSGLAALNVVSAALDADPRTADTPARFAKTLDTFVDGIRETAAGGCKVVAAWSFYSTDFERFTEELATVRTRTDGLDVLHIAGGVHATAEPLAESSSRWDSRTARGARMWCRPSGSFVIAARRRPNPASELAGYH